jgi:hypothetical protein
MIRSALLTGWGLLVWQSMGSAQPPQAQQRLTSSRYLALARGRPADRVLTRFVIDLEQLYLAERFRDVTELSPVVPGGVAPHPLLFPPKILPLTMTWEEEALTALSDWGAAMDLCAKVALRYWDLHDRTIRLSTEADRRGQQELRQSLVALRPEVEACLARGATRKAAFDAIIWPHREKVYQQMGADYGLLYVPKPPPSPRRP